MDGFRRIAETIEPIVPIDGMALAVEHRKLRRDGGQIGVVVAHDRVRPGLAIAIVVGDPLREQEGAAAVHDEVVEDQLQPVSADAEPDERQTEQRCRA
jgi:hypothetical protein